VGKKSRSIFASENVSFLVSPERPQIITGNHSKHTTTAADYESSQLPVATSFITIHNKPLSTGHLAGTVLSTFFSKTSLMLKHYKSYVTQIPLEPGTVIYRSNPSVKLADEYRGLLFRSSPSASYRKLYLVE
jgi:hypothetical protein